MLGGGKVGGVGWAKARGEELLEGGQIRGATFGMQINKTTLKRFEHISYL